MPRERELRPWQLRLAPAEDDQAERIAKRRMASKNDVVRHAVRLLARLEEEAAGGARLLIERGGAGGTVTAVEVWLLW